MLRCVSPYKAGSLAFSVGEVVTDPKLEAHLLVDSPGSFERVSDEPGGVHTEALDEPQVDKMMRAPKARKGGSK